MLRKNRAGLDDRHADCSGQATPGPEAPAGTVNVLGDDRYLPAYLVFKTPVYATAAGEVRTALDPMTKTPTPIGDFPSPLPPPAWRAPEFDDSTWDRNRAPVEMGPGGATGRSPPRPPYRHPQFPHLPARHVRGP